MNKAEDLNLNVFNIITGINESKILTKHTLWKCECKFDGRNCNLNQKWNIDKCLCQGKNPKEHHVSKKFKWNPAICSCENGKYLGSIIDNSVIRCNDFIETTKTMPTKTVPTNFNEKR